MISTALSLPFSEPLIFDAHDQDTQPLDLSFYSKRHEDAARVCVTDGHEDVTRVCVTDGHEDVTRACVTRPGSSSRSSSSSSCSSSHSHRVSPYLHTVKKHGKSSPRRTPSPNETESSESTTSPSWIEDSRSYSFNQTLTSGSYTKMSNNSSTKYTFHLSTPLSASTYTRNEIASPKLTTKHKSLENPSMNFEHNADNDSYGKLACVQDNSAPCFQGKHAKLMKLLLNHDNNNEPHYNYSKLNSSSTEDFGRATVTNCPSGSPYSYIEQTLSTNHDKGSEELRGNKYVFFTKTTQGCDTPTSVSETSSSDGVRRFANRENDKNEHVSIVGVSSSSEEGLQNYQLKQEVFKHQRNDECLPSSSPIYRYKPSLSSNNWNNLKSNYEDSGSVGQLSLENPNENNCSDKENNFRRKNTKHRVLSTSSDNISSSTDAGGIVNDGHTHNREHENGGYVSPSSSECEPFTDSYKISLLDFWISKVLMERCDESTLPSKPCNVDYICTSSGEKKIRFRLTDLIELQVEQSLKA